jgi:hypothetical protein
LESFEHRNLNHWRVFIPICIQVQTMMSAPGTCFQGRLNGMFASPWKQISQSLVSTHGPSQAKVGMTPQITSRNCLLSILGKWVQSFLDIIRQERLAHPRAMLKFVDPDRCTWRYQQLLCDGVALIPMRDRSLSNLISLDQALVRVSTARPRTS